jgi:glutamine---fructose-6-phosphate transaminase (isomerizing)
MRNEIYEIPYRAELCYQKNKGIILPDNVPYIGMGSSFYAALLFKYLGINISPEQSYGFHKYLHQQFSIKSGVLISQSGESSETIWCAEKFVTFISISNEQESYLSKLPNCSKSVDLFAGREDLVPSKTYINTLVVLYLGFGFNIAEALTVMKGNFIKYIEEGVFIGNLMLKSIKSRKRRGIYILGNGPNIATAHQVALVLSQMTKMPFIPLSVSEYDHGYKETASNSLVITINPADSAEYERTAEISKTIEKAGAITYNLNEPNVELMFSPLIFPIPFYFASDFLFHKLKIKNTYQVGTKVTQSKYR